MKNELKRHEWLALAIMILALVGIFAYGVFVLLL